MHQTEGLFYGYMFLECRRTSHNGSYIEQSHDSTWWIFVGTLVVVAPFFKKSGRICGRLRVSQNLDQEDLG